jgi:glycosyltransferase involved in cell wall biosynthesis
MKINIVYNKAFPFDLGGGERRLFAVAKTFAQNGHEVKWLCSLPATLGNYVYEDGIEYVSVSRSITKSSARRALKDEFLFALNILKYSNKIDGDIVFVGQTPWLHFFSILFIRLIRRKRFRVALDLWEYWGSYWFKYYAPIVASIGFVLEKIAIFLSTETIVISEFGERKVREGFPNKKNLILIPNGFDDEILTLPQLKRKKNKIVYFGRLEPHKNVEILIRTIAMIKQKYEEVELEILGAGSDFERLSDLVKNLQLQGFVKITGKYLASVDAFKIMKASSVFVQPSLSEGGGSIAVFEALACGLPTVIFKHPQGIDPLLIENGLYGEIVEEITPQALADALEKMFIRLSVDQNLHQDCMLHAEKYTWSSIGKLYLNVFEGNS